MQKYVEPLNDGETTIATLHSRKRFAIRIPMNIQHKMNE